MASGDIDTGVGEVKPDVTKWRLKEVRFLVPTRTCIVNYNKLDASNNVIERSANIVFQDRADDPETPEDESSTEFTQLVTAINNGNNIKNTITAAVKLKLGI